MRLAGFREQLLSFLFRNACCICQQSLEGADDEPAVSTNSAPAKICRSCFDDVTVDLVDRCRFCGAVIETVNPFGERCRGCRQWKYPLKRSFCIGNYEGPLREAVLAVKRELDDVKAIQLGGVLGSLFDKFDLPDSIDLAVPVPSHWRRRFERSGLHIADLICDGFSTATGIARSSGALVCRKYACKQSTLSTKARKRNVTGVFSVNRRRSFEGQRIILVDDVMTTGATIGECSRVLTRAGAAEVYAAVCARGVGSGWAS